MTRRRWFWQGVKCGFAMALGGAINTYFVSPAAQKPTSGDLQFLSWEQGYKNYIDRKYDLYRDADLHFWEIMT